MKLFGRIVLFCAVSITTMLTLLPASIDFWQAHLDKTESTITIRNQSVHIARLETQNEALKILIHESNQ